MRETLPHLRVGMRIEHDGRAALQYQQLVKLARLLTQGIADGVTDLDCITIVGAAGAWLDGRKEMRDGQ